MSRILLFTGKGGVGKTTTAAATALRAARAGKKTLVMSADPAHSLSDAVDTKLGPEPVELVPNLFAQEIDLYYSMRKYWGNIRQLLLTVFRWQGVHETVAEELAALPGSEEASALLWLEQAYREDDYDLIVVDSAPTGETLTLLTLPQITQWWLTRAFPFQKAAVTSFGALIRKATDIPVDKGYEELDALFNKLNVIQEVMADPSKSSVRLVVNPERMVIQEGMRAYTYLQLYGFPVDGVVVNRVLPEEAKDGVFASYYNAQSGYLQEIEDSFAPLPILHVPHLGREVFGLELLEEIGEALYADRDPAGIYYEERPYEIVSEDKAYVMNVRLPFVEDQMPEVKQFGDSLVITLGNRRRNVLLPRFLSYYTAGEVTLDAGTLSVRFTPNGT
ncbi:MAG: TRC40/GET3/ArsA family transport-energizing ATPase [Bacteroidota bacterium]